MEKTKVSDKSGDRKYFTMTPNLVWAKARNPHDLTLWIVIKSVCGEDGECILSTKDLSLLAMMSVGQVQDSRDYLLKEKLLTGKVYRDPEYPQPVWHLTIPDIWKRNTEFSENLKLKDKISYKDQQAISLLKREKPCNRCETIFIPMGRKSNRCDKCQADINAEQELALRQQRDLKSQFEVKQCKQCEVKSNLEIHISENPKDGKNGRYELLCFRCHDYRHTEHSSGERQEHSSGELGTIPGENGTPPDEKGTTPGETNNIHNKNQLRSFEIHSAAPNGASHVHKLRKTGKVQKATDADIREIIDYLNSRTGQNYRVTTNKSRVLINARIAEGFTVDEFKTVIDKKCADWMGNEFEKYLRPETLFGSKFEGYLNQPTRTHGNGKLTKANRNLAHIAEWLDGEVAAKRMTEQQKQNYILTGSLDG